MIVVAWIVVGLTLALLVYRLIEWEILLFTIGVVAAMAITAWSVGYIGYYYTHPRQPARQPAVSQVHTNLPESP